MKPKRAKHKPPATAPRVTDGQPDIRQLMDELSEALNKRDFAEGVHDGPVYIHQRLFDAVKMSPNHGGAIDFLPIHSPKFSGRPVVVFNDSDVWFYLKKESK